MRIIRKPGAGAEALRKILASIDSHTGKVGWFESSKYPDSTPTAYVAAIQEFGYPAKNIPPRLGMRATATAQENYWAQVAKVIAQRLAKGEASVKDVMEALVTTAAADFQKTITQVTEPPLKESTLISRKQKRGIKSKGVEGVSTKPLVDTGYLLATLTGSTERKK